MVDLPRSVVVSRRVWRREPFSNIQCQSCLPCGRASVLTSKDMKAANNEHIMSLGISKLTFLISRRQRFMLTSAPSREGYAPDLSPVTALPISDFANSISSCIKLSSFLRTSSISVLPNRFLKYISDRVLEWTGVKKIPKKTLTCSPTCHLPRRNREDRQYFSRNLNVHLDHFRGRQDPCIVAKGLQKYLDLRKEFDKRIVTRPHILCCL
jgi:hypothetical protein